MREISFSRGSTIFRFSFTVFIVNLSEHSQAYKDTNSVGIKGESHIDFRTQCVIMTLAEGGVIANDVSKIRKVIEFQSLYPAKAHLFWSSISCNSNRQVI